MGTVRTLEQRRAEYALECIKGYGGKDAAKYRTLVQRLPVMVLRHGLGQALAYLCADAGTDTDHPSRKLYDDLRQWLQGTADERHPDRVYAPGPELLSAVLDGGRDEYRQAQVATLGLLAWMRKFAEAFLAKEA